MSHLRKLGKKKYQIIIDLGRDKNGKRIRKFKTVHAAKPEAEDIMVKMEAELMDKPISVVKNDVTFEQHIKEWFDSHKKNLKPLTIESYQQQIDNHIIPELGHYKLKELNAKILDDFYDDRLKNGRLNGPGGLSSRSVRYLHSIIHKSLEMAKEWSRITQNPADNAHPPKKKKSKANYFTKEQIQKIFDVIDDEYYRNILEFTLRTGMRRGEVIGLQWECITDKNIIVRQNLQRLDNEGFLLQKTTKNEEIYNIPLTPKLKKILQQVKDRQEKQKALLKEKYKDDGFVFAREDGSPPDPDAITETIGEYIKKAGLKGTLHDIRHSFASIQLQNGTPMKAIQELLGHKSYSTTADIYSHVPSEFKEDIMKKMDDIL